MPRKLELTWLAGSKRWRKKYKGRQYYFVGGTTKSDLKGYAQAYDAWLAKKAEIDADSEAAKPNRNDYEKAIASLIEMQDWFGEKGNQEGLRSTSQRIDELQQALALDAPPALSQLERDPYAGMSEVGKQVWADRLQRSRAAPKTDATVARYIRLFLDRKRTLASSGELSLDQYDLLRVCLEHFERWHGGTRPIESIDSTTLIEYHSALLSQATSGGKGGSRHSAKHRMGRLRQFVRWCWELGALELPRNINSADLRITLPTPQIRTINAALFRQMIDAATPSTKLYLLLMANCGFGQQDIADLEHDEVNWKKGRLARKRSKTAKHSNVPSVEFKLWPETFDLLKKQRSDHPSLVLLNQQGDPLKSRSLKSQSGKSDRIAKKDAVRSAYRRLCES